MNHKLLLVLFSGCIFFSGCDDIFEKDIESSAMTLISPADSVRTDISTITFWWESLNGATEYELQVGRPSFDAIVKLVLDTLIETNKFTYSLLPGNYEWRVRGLNSAYSTDYFYSSFQIDSTLDLSHQEIVLVSPSDNFYTRGSSIILNWEKLYNALEYHVDIKSPDRNGSKVVNTKITPYDTMKISLPEGKYAWGVRASNDGSVSAFSFNNIMVDQTLPGIPTLTMPNVNASLDQGEIEFVWERITDNGSPLFDSLFLSTDSIFSSSGIKQKLRAEGTSKNIEITDNGTYFWKVRTCDKAGNRGGFSLIRKFKISDN